MGWEGRGGEGRGGEGRVNSSTRGINGTCSSAESIKRCFTFGPPVSKVVNYVNNTNTKISNIQCTRTCTTINLCF